MSLRPIKIGIKGKICLKYTLLEYGILFDENIIHNFEINK